jgi:hypothetical protein
MVRYPSAGLLPGAMDSGLFPETLPPSMEMNMQLSAVYQRSMWMIIYHIEPNSEMVELVCNKLFKSKKKALKWFARKRRSEDYVQPEAVRVYGLHNLELHPDRMMESVLDSQYRGSKTIIPPILADEETFGSKPR